MQNFVSGWNARFVIWLRTFVASGGMGSPTAVHMSLLLSEPPFAFA